MVPQCWKAHNSLPYLSRIFFLFAGPIASSCRLGWLMYSTVRLKKEFHT